MNGTPSVTITARQESRWRCGVEHTGTPIVYDAGFWTEEQLQQLRADPRLLVIEHGDLIDSDGEDPVFRIFDMAAKLDDGDLVAVMQGFVTIVEDRGLTAADIQDLIRLSNPQTATSEERDPPGGASQEAPGDDPAQDSQPSGAAGTDQGKDAPQGGDLEPSPPTLTREERILVAMGMLDPKKEGDFTKSGKPQVEALEEWTLLDDISADERDRLWEKHLAEAGKDLSGG